MMNTIIKIATFVLKKQLKFVLHMYVYKAPIAYTSINCAWSFAILCRLHQKKALLHHSAASCIRIICTWFRDKTEIME